MQVPVDTLIKNRRALAKIGDREITLRLPPQMVTSRSPCGARPVHLARLYSMLVSTAVAAAPLRATAPASTGGARYGCTRPVGPTEPATGPCVGLLCSRSAGPWPLPLPLGNGKLACSGLVRSHVHAHARRNGLPAISAPHDHPQSCSHSAKSHRWECGRLTEARRVWTASREWRCDVGHCAVCTSIGHSGVAGSPLG